MTQNIDFLARASVLSKTVGTITNTDHQVTICKANEKSVQVQESILHSPIEHSYFEGEIQNRFLEIGFRRADSQFTRAY